MQRHASYLSPPLCLSLEHQPGYLASGTYDLPGISYQGALLSKASRFVNHRVSSGSGGSWNLRVGVNVAVNKWLLIVMRTRTTEGNPCCEKMLETGVIAGSFNNLEGQKFGNI